MPRTRKNPEVVDPLAAYRESRAAGTQPTPVPQPTPAPTPVPQPAPVPLPEYPEGVASLVLQHKPTELTPEEKRIRDLEDQLARERGRKDPEIEYEEAPTNGEDTILIHFVADGLSALGRIWLRGQELEFIVGSQAHKDTFDRRGWSWLNLRDDEQAQIERYNEVKFRSGPWPGKPISAIADAQWDSLGLKPDESDLQAAQAAEAKRNRAAPRLAMR